jgi:hypothetical protein
LAIVRRQNFDIAISAHQRAGIAGRNRNIGLTGLYGLDRPPHGRDIAAAAQRLAGLLVHADGKLAVMENRFVAEFGKIRQNRIALLFQPVESEGDIRMPLQCLCGTWDDNLGTKVATHEVERNSNHASLILLFAGEAKFRPKYRFS